MSNLGTGERELLRAFMTLTGPERSDLADKYRDLFYQLETWALDELLGDEIGS